jgi:CheY-like chemotaxis protein
MAIRNIETYTAARSRFMLVVDSNERNRRLLSGLLKQFEYSAYAVGTAWEALELAAVVSPVLVVTAGQLDSGNDAIALIRSFKLANPTCSAPFVVLTAKADPAFERECLDAGALICLRAPVTFENFYRVIQVAVESVPRMTIRIGTSLPVTINETRMDESVQDISENGAYVLSPSLFPIRTTLPIRIELADSEVSADAMVIYLKRAGGGRKGESGMGLEFVRISEEDRQRIRLFIRKEMTKNMNIAPPAG